MRKTDKKRETQIIKVLTEVCEEAKYTCTGFEWLTHTVDYQHFPQSLKVTLVFNEHVSEDLMLAEFRKLIPFIQLALKPIIGAMLPAKQIEARCEQRLQ